MVDYEYIKNRYKPKAVDLSRQKVLDTDLKAIQQMDSAGKLEDTDGVNADGTKFMFVLTILGKIKEKRQQFLQWSVTVFNKRTTKQIKIFSKK